MARKSITVLIEDAGRDQGKTFVIRELPADEGEQWAIRALLVLMASGIQLPEGALQAGFAGLAEVGVDKFFGAVPYDQLRPLLLEMTASIAYQGTAPGAPEMPIGAGINCAVEEIKTFLTLRRKWLELHLGFFTADKAPTTA